MFLAVKIYMHTEFCFFSEGYQHAVHGVKNHQQPPYYLHLNPIRKPKAVIARLS